MIKSHLGSLRVRLILLVLLAIVPAFVLIVYTGNEHRGESAVVVRNTALDLAKRAANDQAGLVDGSRQLAVSLAQLSEVRSGDGAACTLVFADILRQYPRYVNLIAVHPNGDVFCSAVPRVGKPANISDRKWLQQTIASRGFTVGEYEVGAITGKAEVHVGYPVLDGSGKLLAVVSAGLDLAWLNQLAAEVHLPERSVLTVTDAAGTVLARFPDPAAWLGKSIANTPVFQTISRGEPTASELVDGGISYLHASTPLYGDGEAKKLFLSITIPSEVAYAEADQALGRNLALLALVALAALLATWFSANTLILGQVRALLGATARLAAGDLSARSGVSYGIGELSQLASSFDRMASSLSERQTERDRAEKSLRQYQEHLEEIVEARTNELAQATRQAEEARAAAEAATRAKSEFLANMSHELRTPMNAIIGYSEMLMEEAADGGQDGFVSDLEKIHASGKHLLQLINDILDLSKIEADKLELHLETFGVAPLVHDVMTTFRPLAIKNGNTLSVSLSDDLGSAHGDVTRLRQVLFNLLSNSCKFTEKGEVSLAGIRELVDGREWLVFSVHDTGIGMTPEQLSRLFQKFSQGDSSTTRKYGGTGLGLAISKRFCEMMGGDITVASELGQGTTFTVRLPAQVIQPEQKRSTPTNGSMALDPSSATNLLIIDDDPTMHDLLTRFLSKEGFQTTSASSGEEGIRLAKELRPAAIVLDVLMPGMDGWAVLTSLKADPELVNIPVIMLTIVDEKSLGFALGASDYLTKPVDRDLLVSTAKKYQRLDSPSSILVVEDDSATRQMLCRTFQKEGWSAIEAENGRVALEQLTAGPPRLIVLDLMMPEMDGFEFLVELRRRKEWQSIPVVVLTAKDLTEEDHLRLSGHVENVLNKWSYSREELMKELPGILRASIQKNSVRIEEFVDAKDPIHRR